jgi:3-oxoacyl-[acyl-carrier protein] reductase
MTEKAAVAKRVEGAAPLLVVTGATGGIGQEICRRAAEAGYDVLAAFHTHASRAEELRREVAERGRRCRTVQADLGDPSGIDVVCAAVAEEAGRADAGGLRGLVNNAARLLGPSFDEATIADFDAYFAVNTRAAFFLSQRLSRLMPPGAGIVNISSANAHFSSPGDIVYAMSKAAIESMTRNMAEAIAGRGLRVNAVIPGFTDNGHPAFADPKVREYMSTFDVASPAHVADAVLFLLSDAAARTTGAVLDVSGGSTIGGRGSRAHSVRNLL